MFTPDQTGRLASPHPDLQKTVCGSCAVCKVHLNSSAEPRLLPCLHTVCNTCLTKICTDGEIQDCPLCTKSFSLSEVTECSIFEDSSDKNKDPKCGGCEESEITGWCVQCEEALCLDCMSAHRRVKVTRDHEVTPKKPPTGWIQKRRCPSHTQESLRFFCLVCEELTCKDCQLITHRGHSFVQQEEAVESQRQQLQSLLDSIKHQKETVSSSLLLLEARLQDIEDMKVVAKKTLTQVVFTIYQTLVLSATQVLKNIQALYTEEVKLLLERKASLKRLEGCQDYVAAFTDKLLSTEGYCLLVHAKRIETQVKKLLSQETCTPETMIQLHIQIQQDICQHIMKSGFIRIKKDSIPFTSLRTGSTESKSVSMESSNTNSVETVTDVHPIPASSSADTQVQAECVLNSPTPRPCASSQTVQMNCAFQSLPHASQLSQPFQSNQTTVHSGYNHVASSKLNQSKFTSSHHQSSCSSSPPSVQVQSHEAMSWQSKHACSPSSNCVPYFYPSAHNTHMNPPQSQINNIPESSKLRNAGTIHYYPEMRILTLPMPGNKQKQPTPINYQMPSPTHPVLANIQTPVPTHQIPVNNQTPILTHPVSANNQTPVPTHLMPANNQTPILTHLVSANNQTSVPTHPIPTNNHTPISTHPIPANNQTPISTHPIPANNHTPISTHPIPANNHTPISTHPIPANNQTPISTHPIPANNQTPISTHPIPANNHTPISTHPIPANNQTPISTQPIPANNHTSIFIQPIPSNNQTPLITHTILVSSQTPILTNPKTANVQTPILSQPLPTNNQAPMLAHPKHVNNQTRVLTQPVPNMPRDTQTLILTHPVQTSFLGPVHSFDTQPNIPSAVLSTINANKNSLKDFTAASYVPSTQTSSEELNLCPSDSCTQNPTSPTFKTIPSTPCGSSLPVNPMQYPAISSNNTLWRKKDIYNSTNLPVKALADSACDQEVGVSSMNFTDTDNSESNLPISSVSEADPKEPSADQSSTKSDSGRKHWSAGMASTFRQLVETTCTPIRSIESVTATTDKTAQSGFDHREAKEEEKQSTVMRKHFRGQFKQLKRSPCVSLVRLPISLPLHGQPLPEFHITLDTSTDQILVQESQGGQINQVWRWNEDPISSGAFSCTTSQKSDINSSVASDIEFCAVCQSAGAALLCVKCGCAFHSDCHIPPILTKPRKDWVCLLCQDVNQIAVYDSEEMMMPSLSLHDQRKCEKLLLGLLCDENRCLLYSATKHHSKTAEFDIILGRLLGRRKPPYRTAAELVSDVWTVFDILMMNSEKKNIVVELQKSFQQQLNESFGKSLHASLLKHFSIMDSRGTSETETKKEKHRKTLKRMREFFTTNCSIVAKKPCSEKEEKERDEKSTADER